MSTFDSIEFGDYLTVTDLGSGAIRVDGCAPGGMASLPYASLFSNTKTATGDGTGFDFDGDAIVTNDAATFAKVLVDFYSITALAAAITSFTTNLSGASSD